MDTQEIIKKIRTEYVQSELLEAEIEQNPINQFQKWMHEALKSEVNEPNAMALGTVSEGGQPSVRIVLLRGLDEFGLVFFTNYLSRKGEQISQNPKGALTFFWQELERQVRVEGIIEKVSDEESETYFRSRPKGNRLGAWASPQSQVIPNREFLEAKIKETEAKYPADEVERPAHWGGYRLRPTRMEFWQGRESRLHDRIEYVQEASGNWIIQRLAP